nr:hypothetical protein L204_00899 [Cryptococcus depauperatus CBS 7855]
MAIEPRKMTSHLERRTLTDDEITLADEVKEIIHTTDDSQGCVKFPLNKIVVKDQWEAGERAGSRFFQGDLFQYGLTREILASSAVPALLANRFTQLLRLVPVGLYVYPPLQFIQAKFKKMLKDDFLAEGGVLAIGLLSGYSPKEPDLEEYPKPKSVPDANGIVATLPSRLRDADKTLLQMINKLKLEWKFTAVYNLQETASEENDSASVKQVEDNDEVTEFQQEDDGGSVEMNHFIHKKTVWTSIGFQCLHETSSPTVRVRIANHGTVKDEKLVWIADPADYFLLNEYKVDDGTQVTITLGVVFLLTLPTAGYRLENFV